MRIIIVGVLDKPESTNIQIKQAFESLGHNVIDFNYRTIANQTSYPEMEKQLIEQVKNNQYDLVFLCKTNLMNPEYITELNKYTNTFFWYMDPIEGCINDKATEYAKRATWCSATSKEVFEEFKKVNPNSYKIYEGYNPEISYPKHLPKEYDVIFVGNKDPKREKIINAIKEAGINIKLYGSTWGEPNVYLDKLNDEYNKSKIILNICRSNIFSNRIFDAMATGTLLISDYCDDLVEAFKDNEEIILFKDIDVGIARINYFLKHTYERENIALRGSVANQKHTWKKAMKKVIEVINETND